MRHQSHYFFMSIFILTVLFYSAQITWGNYKPVITNLNLLGQLEHSPESMNMVWETSPQQESQKNLFPAPGEYSKVKGVTTFRGNNFRNTAAFGTVKVTKEELKVEWLKNIGFIDNWSGVGWNGQPAIIEWEEELRKKMNIVNSKRTKRSLKEVIYATLDGKIYFLDLEDGKKTRAVINIGAPIKGSVSIDPRGYPLLFVGQGINTVHGQEVSIGYRIFDLFRQELLFFLNGEDDYAFRKWGAFDSNPLIDSSSDTLLIGGENGLFYKIKLNTRYESAQRVISVKPQVFRYRYRVPTKHYQGIENSVVAYKKLAYFADNSGLLKAIHIDSLKPLWIRDVTDDTDSTIVIEEKNNEVALFTGCEVDHQGSQGKAYIRKINALTGITIWEKSYKAFYHSKVNGGILGTPVVGKYNLSDLVIFNIARVGGLTRGLLVALDKQTGEEKWSLDLQKYSWSSPVDIYTPEGKGYIILGDSGGNLLMIEGSSGKVLDCINLGANIEGSPAVFENMLVVGTRGQKIYGVRIE